MKQFSQYQKGIILIVIGFAVIFPFFSKLIFKNIIVILGFFLILSGIKLLLGKQKKQDNQL